MILYLHAEANQTCQNDKKKRLHIKKEKFPCVQCTAHEIDNHWAHSSLFEVCNYTVNQER
jgi:deoxycytidylate deaminase